MRTRTRGERIVGGRPARRNGTVATDAQQRAWVAAWQGSDDPAERRRLSGLVVASLEGLVVKYARGAERRWPWVDADGAAQAARVSVLDAMRRWDESKAPPGGTFAGYCTWWVQQSVVAYGTGETRHPLHVPRDNHEVRTARLGAGPESERAMDLAMGADHLTAERVEARSELRHVLRLVSRMRPYLRDSLLSAMDGETITERAARLGKSRQSTSLSLIEARRELSRALRRGA